MPLIRDFLLFVMFMTLFSAEAMAYRYGYYAPYPAYALHAPHGYYPAAMPVPYGYAAYRRPAPSPYAPGESSVQPAGETAAVQGRATVSGARVDSTDAQPEVPLASGLSTKKQAFVTSLLPYIEDENRRLLALRMRVERLLSRLEAGAALGPAEQQALARLAKRYRVAGDPLEQETARAELLRRVDIIPASLALAQAVNESAWGESRFAREANNLFGIWTYDEDRGLKPLRREQGKKHLVRIFDDVGESVRYYMHNLNSHPAYAPLRAIRQQLRAADRDIGGHQLAAGLEKYSARGDVYIGLIRDLIEQNEWARLDAGNRGA